MPQNEKSKYFKKNTAYHKSPSSMPARYCRCLMHVAAKQPDWCLKERAFPKRIKGKLHHVPGYTIRNGKKCYNPYAVCTARAKRKGNVECSAYFNYPNISKHKVESYTFLTKRKAVRVKAESRSKRASKKGKGGGLVLKTGVRGGRYYVSKSGRKRYVTRSKAK